MPQFYPKLHESSNFETGANGAELILQVFTKQKDSMYELLDANLATVNPATSVLTFNSDNGKFMLTK